MASNNNRGGNRGRGSNNNNPEGYNQHDRGWVGNAKERPFTAAAAVGGAVAAGVFLWSRRNQISDQIAGLSDQISEWREGSSQGSSGQDATSTSGEQSFIARSGGGGGAKSQSEFAEEALTLKETGKKARRPKNDGMIDEQIKTGSVAY
ncbi:MAG TPA: hypothetical protein VGB39_02915 [Sphingomicrobium sp.]